MYALMILMLLIQSFSGVVMAATEISKANLKNDHSITTNIQYKNADGTWHDIVCNYICYTEGGNKYPAYCIKHGVHGVDEEGPYTVNISKLLSDDRIWRVITNGYPYKTPAQIGVATADDAYVATKHAINSVLLNRDVKTYYHGANDKGKKVVDAIYNLTQIGRNGKQSMPEADLKVSKAKGMTSYNDTYYYIEYKVSADVDIGSYKMSSIAGFPTGSYVANSKGEKTTSFQGNQNARVMIPKNKVTTDFTGTVKVEAKCKTYPIFFGDAPKSTVQDYAITYDAYGDFEASGKFEEKVDTGKIKVIKQDEESSKPIEGVTYRLSKKDGTVIGNKKTNHKGEVEFGSLYPGEYILQETNTTQHYILDTTQHTMKVEYDAAIVKTLTNKHKKGNLKIVKVDKDNNDITLGGIEFDLLDEDKNIVKHLKTDADGEAVIENINTGNYTLKETKTKREYKLCVDKNITVKWNETTDLTIENEKKKGQVSVYKVDAEDHKVALQGVEFALLDKKHKVIDTLVTDQRGYAISKVFPIGEYYLQETKTNKKYVLNDQLVSVEIKEDDITSMQFENYKKKGKIKILKTSSDDSPMVAIKKGDGLKNVSFNIYDMDDHLVETVKTNEKGEAISKDLEIGKYKIKETSTMRHYLLNQEEYMVTISNDGDIKTVNIQNEPEMPRLDIEKTGPEEAKKNEEIEYQFNLKNTGNVELANFTWTEYIPYHQLTVTKMSTGTYSHKLTYKVYYKTNQREYQMLKEVSADHNEHIDFSTIFLHKNETIEEIKVEFGKVPIGFKSVVAPKLYAKVNKTVTSEETITNETQLEGNHDGYPLQDKDTCDTKIREMKMEKKLPRTGC